MVGYDEQNIYPLVFVNFGKYKVRAFMDTGAGSSYTSSSVPNT